MKTPPLATQTLGTDTPAAGQTMGKPAPALAFFVHEPFGPPRTAGLRVGVIADGTTRGGPNGIAEGAKRVVECAEHCAKRDDVALLAVFVLSPQNLLRRPNGFFAALHAEFLRLAEGVTSGRLLAGIRIEIQGRLDRLKNRGGAAARLAHVLELLCETTAARPRPRLRLVFCVDYDGDTPLALGLNLLIRTGMEAPAVLRLSGLRVQPHTVCVPQVKLWRNFTVADLEHALALAASNTQLGLASGFSSDFIADLLDELGRANFSSPLRITLPLAASAAETNAVLARVAAGPAPLASAVAVTVLTPHRTLRRVGPGDAPVQVHLVTPGLRPLEPPDTPIAWLAPGQPAPVFHLPERNAGDANVHTCEPTPAGIVAGLGRALRFQAAHPPLHGAPRPRCRHERASESQTLADLIEYTAAQPDVPATVIAGAFTGQDRPDPNSTGKLFAARCLAEARASGLVSGEVDWERQAFGYAMTAFAIGFRPPEDRLGPDGDWESGDWEPGDWESGDWESGDWESGDWEPATRAVARIMLALASSDEEITDRVFPGEDRDARHGRLALSIAYLLATISGKPCAVPEVRGTAILQAIGRTWEEFFTAVGPTADKAIVSGLRRAVLDLYCANIAEISAAEPLLHAQAQRPSAGFAEAVERLYAASAPEPVAGRIRELARVAFAQWPIHRDSWRELRLLCRLSRVAPSIGAGCALRALAATQPAAAIPAGGAEAMLRVTPLMDYYFRLVNDLAFVDATQGDRDDKLNTFTYLLPADVTGKVREQACVDALRTCRGIAAWLETQIHTALDTLSQLWPLGAHWLQRGMHVGRRVYEVGHYERLAPAVMADIVAEFASAGLHSGHEP